MEGSPGDFRGKFLRKTELVRVFRQLQLIPKHQCVSVKPLSPYPTLPGIWNTWMQVCDFSTVPNTLGKAGLGAGTKLRIARKTSNNRNWRETLRYVYSLCYICVCKSGRLVEQNNGKWLKTEEKWGYAKCTEKAWGNPWNYWKFIWVIIWPYPSKLQKHIPLT